MVTLFEAFLFLEEIPTPASSVLDEDEKINGNRTKRKSEV